MSSGSEEEIYGFVRATTVITHLLTGSQDPRSSIGKKSALLSEILNST